MKRYSSAGVLALFLVLLLLPVVVFASGGATAIDFKGGRCTISADGAYTAAGDSGGKTITVESGVDFGAVVIASDFTGSIHAVGGDASKSEFGAGAGIGSGGFNMYDSPWGNVAGSIEIGGGSITSCGGDWYSSTYSGGAAGIGGGGGQGDWDTATSDITITIT